MPINLGFILVLGSRGLMAYGVAGALIGVLVLSGLRHLEPNVDKLPVWVLGAVSSVLILASIVIATVPRRVTCMARARHEERLSARPPAASTAGRPQPWCRKRAQSC
jgi:hypothetical protein